MIRLRNSVSALAIMALAPVAMAGVAQANDKLVEKSKSDENWVMPVRTTTRTITAI